MAADFWGRISSSACAPAGIAQRPAAQGAGEGNTTTRYPLGGTVLRRREEHPHPHSLRGYRDPETQALPPPRVPLVYSKDAPGVIEIHLRSTGAPWEWQVRPVSNTRMPGAPGNPQVHLGNLQVHLMRTLLVKARLSGRYLTTGAWSGGTEHTCVNPMRYTHTR